jgi:hypothetical protein
MNKQINLIGINGSINSGKDLTGKIIQYLTSDCSNDKIGRYRTYQQFIDNDGGSDSRNFDFHYQSDWEIHKFAGALKQIASILTGIDVKKFEDQDFKHTELEREWDKYIYDHFQKDKLLRIETMTVRSFLQKLGTDAIRNGLHENCWINAAFSEFISNDKYELEEGTASDGGYYNKRILTAQQSRWIFSDMRFENEFDAIKSRGGLTIRVNRTAINPSFVDVMRPYSNHVNYGIPMPELHPSETSLDNHSFDETIINDGTIEDLIEKVKTILIKYKIIN